MKGRRGGMIDDVGDLERWCAWWGIGEPPVSTAPKVRANLLNHFIIEDSGGLLV